MSTNNSSLFYFYKLRNLFYKKLVPNNRLLQAFELTYNKTQYTMLMNTDQLSDGKVILTFAKKQTLQTLRLTLNDEFAIHTFLGDKLFDVKDFFNIKSNNNCKKFIVFDFLLELQSTFKTSKIDTTIDRATRSKMNNVEDPDAIFYNVIIDWSTKTSGNHHTAKNRAKVQLLLPELYEAIKDLDISVRFTSKSKLPSEERAAILQDLNVDLRNLH